MDRHHRRRQSPLLLAALALAAASSRAVWAAGAAAPAGIEEFNRALIDATKRMDNAATLALWEEDGISILPQSQPLVGKGAIAAFLKDVTAKNPGGQMTSFTCNCSEISVSGDWASEWCVEHQIVKFPGNAPPFDGWGNLLFVLHRGGDGRWRIRTEMWSPALPGAKPGHP